MKTISKIVLAAALAGFLPAGNADALQQPKRTGGDALIGAYKYAPNEVYGLHVSPLNITYIEFPRGERVQSIGAGDTESYEFHRLEAGNVVTVKPATQRPTRTNMTIITNRRTYSFQIIPRGRSGYYRVSFEYPPEPDAGPTGGSFLDQTTGITPTGTPINKNYVKAGDATFSPVGMWDDGVHTYIQFSPTQPRPAVFRVDANGFEETINVTQHPNHLIQIHGLSPEWTLRIGDQALCVKNKSMSYPKGSAPRRSGGQKVAASERVEK